MSNLTSALPAGNRDTGVADNPHRAEPAIVAMARIAGGSIAVLRSWMMSNDWRYRREQRIAATVDALLHPGVLADFEQARRD